MGVHGQRPQCEQQEQVGPQFQREPMFLGIVVHALPPAPAVDRAQQHEEQHRAARDGQPAQRRHRRPPKVDHQRQQHDTRGIRNRDLHFICDHVYVRVETSDSPFTNEIQAGSVLRIPIAHAEGNYVCDDRTLDELKQQDRIVFRYCDETGAITEAANPNGSRENIAGICNRERNVLGLMPHPERACEDLLGSSDGRDIFRSLAATLAAAV